MIRNGPWRRTPAKEMDAGISTEAAMWVMGIYSALLVITGIGIASAWFRNRIESLQRRIDIYKGFQPGKARTWSETSNVAVGSHNHHSTPEPDNVVRAAFLGRKL